MADLAGVHLSSTEVDWRALLAPLEDWFEELARPEVPLISFVATSGGSDVPPGIGTLEESDGCERVLLREGAFPGKCLPTNAGMGYFSIPEIADRAKAMAAWEQFLKNASRAWSVLPENVRSQFDIGADEFRWIAVVCSVLRQAGTAVSFSYPAFAGIRPTTGCAAASAMAIHLICRGKINLTFAAAATASIEEILAKDSDVTSRKEPLLSAPIGSPDDTSLVPFTGGTLVFFHDRVELSGVDICGGRGWENARRLLELLRIQGADSVFIAYSAANLAAKLGLAVAKAGAVSALIYRLRRRTSQALRDRAGIDCQPTDLILSRGSGYRLSQNLTVRIHESLTHDHGQSQSDVPGHVPNDVRNVHKQDVRKPEESANLGRSSPGERRGWILQQLREGNRVGAREVAQEFRCSNKTATRDFTQLKVDGRIRFDGAPATGVYRLIDTAEAPATI